MAIRTLLISAGLLLMLAACDFNKTEHAQKLSNRIMAVNDSLQYYGKQWNDELQVATTNKDFSRLSGIRTDLQDFLNRKIIDVSALKDVGGSKEFRNAELELLHFDADSILPRLAVFEVFNTGTPDSIIVGAYSSLINGSFRSEDAILKKVHALMDDYADANDFPKPIDEYPQLHGRDTAPNNISKPPASGDRGN